jgi:Xaa-Pro aminopeptidase
MRSDLDRLMSEADIDAIWITGKGSNNPSLQYFVGQAHLVRAEILKRRGWPAVLYHAQTERDEAEMTGLETVISSRESEIRALEAAEGKSLLALALIMRDRIMEQGIEGRVGIHGVDDSGRILGIVRHLEQLLPSCEFLASDVGDSPLAEARMTKDPDEIERMRRVARASVDVVRQVEELLRNSQVEGDHLVDDGGKLVTIGAVKRRVHLLLAERGLQSPNGPILAMGRDGAMGHSVGQEDQPLQLGVPIVFDLFPQEMGGGYNFDFTRTWCLGHASAEVAELHGQVLAAHEAMLPLLKPGALPKDLQAEVCSLLEAMGHPTVNTDPDGSEGFPHALAHGIGLEIHEPPIFYEHKADAYRPLEPRMVISFEPGLYYPDRGIGVRLEDTVLVREGTPEILAPYPHELVIPIRQGTAAGALDGS